ncbi:MAG: hypothetical protein K2H56_02580 [Malacoplasma sp.]|nr:hypothetical protein [Malacoplasma sp.]
MRKFLNNIFNKNKIGKNDNLDVGSWKNNKSKNVMKNSEIKNVSLNTDKDLINFMKEIARKKRKISFNEKVIEKCKNCQEIIIEKKKKEIDDEIERIKNDSSDNGILESIGPYSYNKNNNQYIESKINLLIQKKEKINQIFNKSVCKKHHKLYDNAYLDKVELDSLEKNFIRLTQKK